MTTLFQVKPFLSISTSYNFSLIIKSLLAKHLSLLIKLSKSRETAVQEKEGINKEKKTPTELQGNHQTLTSPSLISGP
jgi:hypothetical protein